MQRTVKIIITTFELRMKSLRFPSFIAESPIKIWIDMEAMAMLNIIPVIRIVLRVAEATP